MAGDLFGGISKKSLARIIEADLLREPEHKPSTYRVADCFTCGRSFLHKGCDGDNSGRFCSTRCREGFDAGWPPYDPAYAHKTNPRWYSLPMGPRGFFINCASWGKRFDSIGLRCCSTPYERDYRAAEERGKHKITRYASRPTCEVCHTVIARRGRRRSPRTARFCSDACRKKQARLPNLALETWSPDLSARTAKLANDVNEVESRKNTLGPSSRSAR